MAGAIGPGSPSELGLTPWTSKIRGQWVDLLVADASYTFFLDPEFPHRYILVRHPAELALGMHGAAKKTYCDTTRRIRQLL